MSFYRGVFSAPDVEVAPCGILSVVKEVRHTRRLSDERWIRGYNYEILTAPYSVDLISVNDPTIADGNLYDGNGAEQYYEGSPFFIQVTAKQSGLAVDQKTWQSEILEQLDTVTQKAIEVELWSGPVADASGTAVPFLTKSGGADVLTSGGVHPRKALYLLEQAVAAHPLGARGTIHMTRDVASALGSRLLYKEGKEGYESYAVTRLGTDVVIGSGYSGNGPVGETEAEASETNKWMYVTGAVEVHIGKGEIDVADLGQGFTSDNTVNYKAIRPAAVHFDPTVWATAQVTLPDAP